MSTGTFVPTTTARRRALHLRVRTNHLRSLCGQRVRYDAVHAEGSQVCGRCTTAARKIARLFVVLDDEGS